MITELKNQVTALSEKSIPTLIGDVQHLAPTKLPRPDLTLRFVSPTEVAILIDNAAHAGVADRPKYAVMLIDLDNPTNYLQIPTFMGDYIRPGESMGPNQFMGLDAVKAVVKPGDRIFGSVSVMCPKCVKSRSYWLFIKANEGGWYEEQQGQAKVLKNLDSAKTMAANLDAYTEILAPAANRIPIEDIASSLRK